MKKSRYLLDSQLSAHENSVKYFDRYAKLKRTWEALSVQIQETKDELEHLDSISTALDIAVSEDDLIQLKEELIQFGYIKRHYSGKRATKKSALTASHSTISHQMASICMWARITSRTKN